jgi:DNA uptake protein ComE-like DNA-binding protein
MNYSLKLSFGIALLTVGLFACQTKADSTTKNAQEQEVASDTVMNTVNSVLNVNLATEQDLLDVGFSAEFIQEILEKRPFLSMTDFDAMITENFNKDSLYTKVFVPMNLNTTAEADFKMIPGVGDRMAHEFEEYRPYTSIKQFRTQSEQIKQAELEQSIQALANGADAESVLRQLSNRLTNKLIHTPTQAMQQAAQNGEPEKLAVMRACLGLDSDN